MGQHAVSAAAAARGTWLARGFLVLAALWLVAQGHRGSFLASWTDEASLPGNICWLLILYCLVRLLIDRGSAGDRPWPLSRDGLLLLAGLAAMELVWRLLANDMMVLTAFAAQPLMVVLGLGALHRRQRRSAPTAR